MAAVADEIEPAAKALIGDGVDDTLVAAASAAISLRRIADVLQGFGDHPDNANSYGETGMRAVQGTLERTASSIVNEVSMALHHMRGNR